ncbi:hypothetical protein [Brevundimonas naejangsanensis]|uniref:hypothetical protein n=1 Tax=Brevundimonas naejangsanensis TaxID=588932 RepID=UPI0026EF6818|nr:hypothetical protein [Brevundimonas naejangsanensis]
MTGAPQRSPLSWPAQRPRTPAHRRQNGKFKQGGGAITVAGAMDRVEAEIQRIGGINALLSSNLDLRLDGRPRSGGSRPADPGVCLYFTLKAEPFALACDTYTEVAQNIAALAAHLDATRAITRHGVASAAETLQAFSALPPPSAPVVRSCWAVLGLTREAVMALPANVRAAAINEAWRGLSREKHPDAGGDQAAQADLNAARAEALKEITP